MARPTAHDDAIKIALAGGRMASHGDLLRMGVSRSAILRMIDRDILVKRSRDIYVLASDQRDDPLPALATRYGGVSWQPFGVVCLQIAAYVHNLTDMGLHNIIKPEVAVPHDTRLIPTGGLPMRIVRLRTRHALDDLEWHEHGGHGIHVTNSARTVCDLYSPWAGELPEGLAQESLARLLDRDAMLARAAADRATDLGWGRAITADLEAMRMARRYTPMPEGSDVGGMTL